MMELKINPFTVPEALSFNYEELKTAILKKADDYAAVVYTEDQMKAAKADRANLNRLKKALNDERIRQEKEYMQPFADFKAQINEIISIIDKPVAAIDKQIKDYEDQQKEEKFALIEEFWNGCDLPAPIKLLQIMDTKWLNASVPMKTIQAAITDRLCQIANDLDVVRNMPAYAFEAEQVYITTLDLGKAISEASRLQEMAKLKADQEAEKNAQAAPSAQLPDKVWLAFEAFVSPAESKALGEYLRNNGIKYRAV